MTIEKLARLLLDEPPSSTLGQLAEKYGEPAQRIADAFDVLKIREGQPTLLPPVDWA